jgi:hypothetical protein
VGFGENDRQPGAGPPSVSAIPVYQSQACYSSAQ